MKTPFEFLKPRSGKSEARKRERVVARKIVACSSFIYPLTKLGDSFVFLFL
jgi:hypothetical protein